MLHWASLIIFFVLSVLALWVVETFLQKNGIYFFSIVAIIVSAYFSQVHLFGFSLNAQLVIIPVLFYVLYLTYSKYGSSESIRLFYVTIFSVITMFILRFFEFALLDIFNGISDYLSWAFLKDYVANIVAFAICCVGGYFFVKYVTLNKVHQILRTAIYIAIFSAINSLIFVIITTPSFLGFVDVLLLFLLMLAFDVILPLLLGCYDYFTNKNPLQSTSQSVTKKESKPTPVKQEEKEKKLSNFFNSKTSNSTTEKSTAKTTTTASAKTPTNTSKPNVASSTKPSVESSKSTKTPKK